MKKIVLVFILVFCVLNAGTNNLKQKNCPFPIDFDKWELQRDFEMRDNEFIKSIQNSLDDISYECLADNGVPELIEISQCQKTPSDSLLFNIINMYNEAFIIRYEDETNTEDETNKINKKTTCKNTHCTTEGYDEKDKLVFTSNCLNGKNHGTQSMYSSDGRLLVELNYTNGRLNGKQKFISKFIDESDFLNEVEIINGKLNGKLKIYHIKHTDYGYIGGGLIGEFKNGKPVGNLENWLGDNLVVNTHLYITKIPFDKNSNINGSLINKFQNLKELGDNYLKLVVSNYKDNKIISYEDYHGEYDFLGCEYDEKSLNKCVKSYVKELENAEIPKEFYKNKAKAMAKYSQGQFDSKEKVGSWIKYEIAQYNDYNLLETTKYNFTNNLNWVEKIYINNKLKREKTFINGEIDNYKEIE
ncbi:hypothetical protein DCO58_09600 [Helicobacter saguini]|uniref:Toxin-antitoxin system YwqK family antitoxin n=1 Tax=Helicobacter saguini TaxID=1548018 RepID=A0A347VPB8_9HELI|nr:hypothetical protein [Helicobacter saguini]MWV61429.1 hypothetical protein [Helicobacter saguini]MWV67901.1 hypothetical protein [Helicobacter saguini]MWV70631.1 hypothetical protein [Helicobacter saguini]MWV72535.1 hypothetical protein [Helicobacter saguini]TLD94726.1 hypothetical protein LS64_004180 [Helicobacter saguini]